MPMKKVFQAVKILWKCKWLIYRNKTVLLFVWNHVGLQIAEYVTIFHIHLIMI